jgi:hypothetical protein
MVATNLKKGLLLTVLLGLLIAEASLLEGFLPYEWPHPTNQLIERIFPRPRYDPHPNMGWEFELDFRQHPWHRAVEYVVLGLLALGDGYLIVKIWRTVRRLRPPGEKQLGQP